jgi:hypothetical protein
MTAGTSYQITKTFISDNMLPAPYTVYYYISREIFERIGTA